MVSGVARNLLAAEDPAGLLEPGKARPAGLLALCGCLRLTLSLTLAAVAGEFVQHTSCFFARLSPEQLSVAVE